MRITGRSLLTPATATVEAAAPRRLQVEGQAPEVVSSADLPGVVRNDAHAGGVPGGTDELRGCGGELLLAEPLELFFRGLELGQGSGDPVGKLAGGHLEHFGQLGDEGAFGGKVPEGIHAHEGLHAAVS